MKVSAIRDNSARKGYAASVAVCLILISILASCLTPPAASGESAADYFNLSYDPAIFSKTDIVMNEAFTITIHGNATCTEDLPPIRTGRIIGRIVAIDISTGHRVVLNSQYTLNIDPFPEDPGEYVEMTVTVPLQFPVSDIPGYYSVVGETISAEVYLLGSWEDVTDTVPASHELGSVHYTTSGATSTLNPTSNPTPTYTLTPSVTPTSGAGVTPAVSPSPTGTAASSASPVPTGATAAGTPSLTPDGSTSPARYGAPIWAAIGLIAILIAAVITLAIMRLQARSKHAVKSDENHPEGDNNKQ